MIEKALLQKLAKEYGVVLTDEQTAKFDRYAQLLVEWNEKMNLTAIIDPVGIVLKHFADSLTAVRFMPQGKSSLVDVGTGAGFPGIPLAIVCPGLKLTLLDSLQKRLKFLEAVTGELGIPCELVHARAEEAGQKLEFREKFDVATARAVAALPVLCEYCLPLVKTGGIFLAMKGPEADREIAASQRALQVLGGKVEKSEQLRLPREPIEGQESYDRSLIVIHKKATTNAKYPRCSAKIMKKPL